MLDRPATVIGCVGGFSMGHTFWVDDATGLLLRGAWGSTGEEMWFAFTHLEIDPEIPAGVFEVASVTGP